MNANGSDMKSSPNKELKYQFTNTDYMKYLTSITHKIKACFISIVRYFFKALPPEGSYIEYATKGQYETRTWKGIVEHHSDGKHYMIKNEKYTLTCLKP